MTEYCKTYRNWSQQAVYFLINPEEKVKANYEILQDAYGNSEDKCFRMDKSFLFWGNNVIYYLCYVEDRLG